MRKRAGGPAKGFHQQPVKSVRNAVNCRTVCAQEEEEERAALLCQRRVSDVPPRGEFGPENICSIAGRAMRPHRFLFSLSLSLSLSSPRFASAVCAVNASAAAAAAPAAVRRATEEGNRNKSTPGPRSSRRADRARTSETRRHSSSSGNSQCVFVCMRVAYAARRDRENDN